MEFVLRCRTMDRVVEGGDQLEHLAYSTVKYLCVILLAL